MRHVQPVCLLLGVPCWTLRAVSIPALTAIERPLPQTEVREFGDGGCQIHHVDRDPAAGMDLSMSHKGDCWDNAVMESFWSTLKTELVHHRRYATRDAARASIFEYIEVFYNRKRLHSALGYQSPEVFEAGLI